MNDSSLTILRGLVEFREYAAKVCEERVQVEKLLSKENANIPSWSMVGYCECCHKPSRLLLDWKCSDGTDVNFRERLVCEYCGLNSRQRFIASYILHLVDTQRNKNDGKTMIYCYEYVTRFFRFLKNYYIPQSFEIIGSEYLSFDCQPGELINGIRHEDAMNLSFFDESLDYIISNDVYEHVPDIGGSLKEAYRVLRHGGKLVFSIPFYYFQDEIRQRALLKDGSIVNILPEQYHGNPVSEKGSLVFYDIGWDILKLCKSSGFKDAYAVSGYSMFHGYMGGFPMIFVAEK